MALKNINPRAAAPGLALFVLGSGLQVSAYQNEAAAAWMGILGVLLLIYSIWDVELGAGILPGSRLPLRDAARRLYEKSRGRMWGQVAERFSENPDEVIQYFCVAVAQRIPIFGQPPPAQTYSLIPPQTFTHARFRDGGAALVDRISGKVLFEGLQITRGGLEQALAWFEQENAALDKQFPGA